MENDDFRESISELFQELKQENAHLSPYYQEKLELFYRVLISAPPIQAFALDELFQELKKTDERDTNSYQRKLRLLKKALIPSVPLDPLLVCRVHAIKELLLCMPEKQLKCEKYIDKIYGKIGFDEDDNGFIAIINDVLEKQESLFTIGYSEITIEEMNFEHMVSMTKKKHYEFFVPIAGKDNILGIIYLLWKDFYPKKIRRHHLKKEDFKSILAILSSVINFINKIYSSKKFDTAQLKNIGLRILKSFIEPQHIGIFSKSFIQGIDQKKLEGYFFIVIYEIACQLMEVQENNSDQIEKIFKSFKKAQKNFTSTFSKWILNTTNSLPELLIQFAGVINLSASDLLKEIRHAREKNTKNILYELELEKRLAHKLLTSTTNAERKISGEKLPKKIRCIAGLNRINENYRALVLILNNGITQELSATNNTFGKASYCDVILSREDINNFEFAIQARGDHYVLHQVQQEVFVNEKPVIDQCRLNKGDIIQIKKDYQILFLDIDLIENFLEPMVYPYNLEVLSVDYDQYDRTSERLFYEIIERVTLAKNKKEILQDLKGSEKITQFRENLIEIEELLQHHALQEKPKITEVLEEALGKITPSPDKASIFLKYPLLDNFWEIASFEREISNE